MKIFFIAVIILTSFFSFSQRPITGQKIFKKQYPVEQINKLTNASLLNAAKSLSLLPGG